MTLPTTFWGWIQLLIDKYGPLFLNGAGFTMLIAISGTVLGFLLGLLVAIVRTIPVSKKDNIFKRILMKLVNVILEAQLDDGGWALSGERSDPDMTGMAIQALAPYMESNTAVNKAVEEAIRTLSELQNDNGSYTSVDGPNSESIAQVIVALAALGIDADTDARFVKN